MAYALTDTADGHPQGDDVDVAATARCDGGHGCRVR
jgi:hypothetical protein